MNKASERISGLYREPMSITAFRKDEAFGLSLEDRVKEHLESKWRNVETTNKTSVIDFVITKGKEKKYIELKSRRCSSKTYPTTMIGLNKLIKAHKIYDTSWYTTLFFFSFTDWLFYLNPQKCLPKYERKAWRWDRGGFDKKKWYCLYDIQDLIPVL